ncbi:hypothetical protein V8F33_005608 [Rhypophila sp. PSN 637]
MPIINGQKMACAPCIRGHRSTKCNHFNERVMVPVRKPGRPLSTCPCPPGKPCACGGVKVAIPRKQQCGCGPENGNPPSPVEQERTPAETPTSPSRPSFRVTKSGSVSRNGRKPSFDPANFGRIDPMTVNIVTPQNGSLDANGVSITAGNLGPQMTPPATSAYMPNIGYVTSGSPNGYHAQNIAYASPLAYTMGSSYPHTPHFPHVKSEDSFPSPQIHNMGLSVQTAPVTNGTKSCCSPPVEEPLPKVDLGPALMASNGVTNGGSCCSNKKDASGSTQNGSSASQPDYEKSFIPQFQSPIDLKPQNFQPPIHFPTVYTYPANYGSWQHPVDQTIWQQIAAHPSIPMGNGIATPTNGTTSGDVGTSHECACVDCKCVGCLAHPFNDQMFQYVNNAYMESPTGTNGHATLSDLASQTPGNNANAGSGAGTGNGNGNGTATVVPPGSPPDAQTPSDASGFSDEQSLSTVDYFFVNLPLRMDGTCGGDLQACPCGDDCQCIGCLVHNNPVPLE